MPLLQVDTSKCVGDEICVKECPMGIIGMDDNGKFPIVTPDDEPFCFDCGHCLAICPKEALTHDRLKIGDCPPIQEGLSIDHLQAVQFLRSRRSVRFYKEMQVEDHKIQKLIEVARYAPTASNSQLVEWIVIRSRQRIQELARLTVEWIRSGLEKSPESAGPAYLPRIVSAWDEGRDMILRNAPIVIIAMAPKEARHGMVDISLALSYLELAAPTLGLGSCLAGLLQGAIVQQPAVKEAAGIPDGYPFHYPVMLGYYKFKYKRLPQRRKPKIKWLE